MKAKWLEKEEEQEQKEFLAIFRQGGPTNYIEIKERPRPHTAQIIYLPRTDSTNNVKGLEFGNFQKISCRMVSSSLSTSFDEKQVKRNAKSTFPVRYLHFQYRM